MLKPLASRYNDPRAAMRWVKLKKDFIPGAGDTLDFHIVGARWSRDRGRELLGQREVDELEGRELTSSSSCSTTLHVHDLLRWSTSE